MPEGLGKIKTFRPLTTLHFTLLRASSLLHTLYSKTFMYREP